MQQECVESAAVKLPGGEIMKGSSHGDVYMTRDADYRLVIRDREGCEEGFVTNFGRFLDRNSAGSIAFAAGQTPNESLFLQSHEVRTPGTFRTSATIDFAAMNLKKPKNDTSYLERRKNRRK